VEIIKKYALESQRDPAVRMLAEEVVQNLGPKDYLSEALAIYYAVIKKTRYCNDPRVTELVKKPAWVIKQIAQGARPSLDCDDLTALLAALLLSLGREVRIATVAFRNAFHNGERQYSHVYLEVKEPRTNRWLTLDPVAAEDTDTMLKRVRAIKYWALA
jgi:transglutaminase-like putative cysteine protease